MLADLPQPERDKYISQYDKVFEAILERDKLFSDDLNEKLSKLLTEAEDQRLRMVYLQFDLESTSQERDALRKELE